MERPKAYSYIRFSTPEQAKGRSYDRQIELASAYAKEHGLELADLTFKDLGVSAFRGKNAQTGALRAFLKAVEDEDIPSGSYLLVENLDRITRNSIIAAQAVFMLIIQAGIILVTLLDKRRYSLESINANPTDLIISIVLMMRGHEESATKARRLADAYEKKRRKAAEGVPFTRMLPAWLRLNEETGKHEADPQRAAVIRSIFEMADEGLGQHQIAQRLNEQRVPTWGGRGNQRRAECWHRSYVKKLLTNSAVIGTFTPHQKDKQTNKRLPLEPIEDYFPAVVDRDLFERVASRTRAPAARGRNAAIEPASIFAGVLRCVHCGGAVTRVAKGEHVYLVCSRANRRGTKACRYLAVPYSNVEDALRGNAREIVRYAPRGRETRALEEEIEQLEVDLDVAGDQARALADELIEEKSEIVRLRLRDKEAEWQAVRGRLRALRAQQEALAKPYVRRKLETLKTALRRKPLNVREVNGALKEAVSKIIFDPEGTLTIYWHHAPEQPDEGIGFVSKHNKMFDAVERAR